MAPLKNNMITWTCGFFSLAVSGLVAALLFGPSIQKSHEEIDHFQQLLVQQQELLSRKEALEKEWENKRHYFASDASLDEAQTRWFKELLSYAQSQALVMSKLEPAGIKKTTRGHESLVQLSFEGDIRLMTSWLYHLLESDPLTNIESFSVRHDDGTEKRLSYEFILAKVLS